MKAWFTFVGLCVLAGCVARPDASRPETTFTYDAEGSVRSINLTLQITGIQHERDIIRVTAKGLIDEKVAVIDVLIPIRWDASTIDPSPSAREFKVVFVRHDDSSYAFDEVVHRSLGDEYSLFSNGKFTMWTRDRADQMESAFTRFGGFAEVDEYGFFQCLFGLDMPRRLLRIAILVQGYGGSPPKAVTEWIKKG